MKRKSRKLSALDFFHTTLFDVLNIDKPSLTQHSLSVDQDYGKQISKQGLDQRFNENTVIFFHSILQNLFSQEVVIDLPSNLQNIFSSIKIKDSTEFKLSNKLRNDFKGFGNGVVPSAAKIQFEYDLFANSINDLSLHHGVESDLRNAMDTLEEIKVGELLLRDLGYNSINIFKNIDHKKAFYISRLKPQINIYSFKNNQFKQLTLKSLISKLKAKGKHTLDLDVWIGKEEKYPVRLTASLLEKEQIQQRLKRIKKKSKVISENSKYSSQLNLIVTNIKRNVLHEQDLYKLYKIRWQVELIFKTWKSIFKIHAYRPMNVNRTKCYIFARLIWILLNWNIYKIVNHQHWKNKQKLVSLYKCGNVVKHQAISLKSILLSNQLSDIIYWLNKIEASICIHAIKEHRRGRNKIEELMDLTLSKK